MLKDCLPPRSGIQGGTYPSKESALLAIGQMQDLVSAAVFLLKNGRVRVNIKVDDNGKRRQTYQILWLREVATISLAVV